MAIALISDIHSNIEALNAVLADIKSQGIKDIYCLGDLVGYGPDPVDIVDASRRRSSDTTASLTLMPTSICV